MGRGISFSVSITHNSGVRHFPLGERKSIVGRDPSCDILIPDPAISRQQLTLEPTDEAVRVEMNPKSPNVMVRNGSARMSDDVHHGECFFVGPYRFEITATADLPEAHPRGLSEDPAGPIDKSQLDEKEHIAPRWRSNDAQQLQALENGNQSQKAQGEGSEQPGLSPSMRIILMVILCLLGGYLIYDFTKEPPAPQNPNAVSFATTDLMAAVPPLSCQSQLECLERARDHHRIATEFLRQSARDLITQYKIARLLHRARRALGSNSGQITNLQVLEERAKAELKVSFADVAFRYERALSEGRLKEQKQILQMLLHLCSEDRHAFCTMAEHAYRRFPDDQQN